MSPLLTDATKNTGLDAITAIISHVGLHSAYPGTTGTNEISGGSPAYGRQSITWNAAASGNADDSNTPTFDVPAGTTVRWIGYWSASTAGTYRGGSPAGAGAVMPFYASASADTLSVDAHGYSAGDVVTVLDAGAGSVLPTGLTEGTEYFVVNVSGDTFKLAATSGGSAIDLTSDGGGFVIKYTPEVFGGQGTYTLTDADITLIG